MGYSRTTNRYVDASTWFSLVDATLGAMIALALVAGTASLFAASIGDPELVALIGGGAIVTILLGLVLARTFSTLGHDGLPVIEDPHPSTRSAR